MRKALLSFLFATTLIACKKETVNADTVVADTTETAVVEEAAPAPTPVNFAEINNQQLGELLKPKANDTLYVTNFFATWCGPCMKEMPHFKEQMEATKGQKVKFTFVSIDPKSDWESKVSSFGQDFGITENIVLYDTANLTADLFPSLTETWDGNSIPFTLITKGDKRVETVGMMTKEDLAAKLTSLQ